MTTALLVVCGMLVVAAFIAGILVGRKSTAPTGTPTPASAQVIVDSAQDADAAAKKAYDEAKGRADDVLHKDTDAEIAERVEKLRARGRAGE